MRTKLINLTYLTLTANYAGANQTALQKIFNTGVSSNGSLAVEANTSYFFECWFGMTGLSSTSSDFSFGILGTATFTSLRWNAFGSKQAIASGPNLPGFGSYLAVTASSICPASTTTQGHAFVQGILRVSAAGTIIPAVGLGSIATPTFLANCYFKLTLIGSDTLTHAGGT